MEEKEEEEVKTNLLISWGALKGAFQAYLDNKLVASWMTSCKQMCCLHTTRSYTVCKFIFT